MKTLVRQIFNKKVFQDGESSAISRATFLNVSGNENRRQFIKKTALGIFSLGTIPIKSFDEAAPSGAGISNAAKTPVIDMHLHCFAGLNDPRFPYHERATYKPAGIASPEHLLVCMNGAGVDHAVVVSPEPYQDDHRYLEYCFDVGFLGGNASRLLCRGW